jgi:hypothetical protein
VLVRCILLLPADSPSMKLLELSKEELSHILLFRFSLSDSALYCLRLWS